MLFLRDKIIAITGGSRGIGRCLVEQAINAHAQIAYCSRTRDESQFEQSVNCLFVIADVSQPEQIKSFIDETISVYGKIDVLVHNAAITKDSLLVNLTLEEWDEVVRTNLTSAYVTSKEIIKQFLQQEHGGHIAFIGSLAGSGAPSNACYAATKGGLVGLAEGIAETYGENHITSNVFVLGLVDTLLTKDYPESARKVLIDACSLKRSASPENIAEQILYLISNCTQLINGKDIHLTGGIKDFPLGSESSLKAQKS